MQHPLILGAHFACIMCRHVARKPWPISEPAKALAKYGANLAAKHEMALLAAGVPKNDPCCSRSRTAREDPIRTEGRDAFRYSASVAASAPMMPPGICYRFAAACGWRLRASSDSTSSRFSLSTQPPACSSSRCPLSRSARNSPEFRASFREDSLTLVSE